MIIDVHGHIGNINMHPSWTSNAAKVSDTVKKSGVDFCIISSGMSIMYDTCRGNNEVLDAVKKYDNLFGYVVVNPFYKETYKDLDYIGKEEKIVGCKIHPDYHGFDLSSSIGRKLIEKVSNFSPLILIHTSCMPGTGFSTAKTICELALKHKNNYFISAHVGGLYQNHLYPYFINYSGIETIAEYNLDNLLVDTASYFIYVYPGVMQNIVNVLSTSNVVFGTDVPLQSSMQIKFKIKAINSLEIPKEEKAKIFYKNIKKIIDI